MQRGAKFVITVHAGRIALVCFMASGCSGRSERQTGPSHSPLVSVFSAPGGPTVALVDSVVLEESDSAYIGRPGHVFHVAADGRYFVSDELSDRLFQFAPDGELERIIGRPGQGPGEFRKIGPVVTTIDSLLLVQSYGTRRLSVFDRRSGRFLFSRTYSGHLTSAVVRAGILYLGNLNVGALLGAVALPLDRLAASDSADVLQSTMLMIPADYRELPELTMFDIVSIAAVPGGLVYGVSAASTLWWVSATGIGRDSIDLPVRRRRGFPDGSRHLFANRQTFDFKKAIESVSDLSGIWAMSDGRLILWHNDGIAEMRGSRLARLSGTPFVSLVSADFQRACVDTPMQTSGNSRPRLAFARDTLYVLDQVVSDSGESGVQAVVRRYSVDDTTCEWVGGR